MPDDGEIIRRSTDAYSRGDIDGFLELWAPEAVVDWSNSRGPDAGVYRGHDQIRGFVERFRGAFEEVRIELVGDPEEISDGVWVVENVTHFRGRDGIEVKAGSAWVIELERGTQVSLTLHQTKAEALDAAGGRG